MNKGNQGDVIFKSLNTLPEGISSIEHKPIALGEHSGHQHVITGDVELFQDYEGNVFACVGSDGATLQHVHESNFTSYEEKGVMPIADHQPIPFSEGVYLFAIQKKYNPFEQVFEEVLD